MEDLIKDLQGSCPWKGVNSNGNTIKTTNNDIENETQEDDNIE